MFLCNQTIFLLCTLELVHQVRGFTVSKAGDGIAHIGVRASELLDGACFPADMIAREGSFEGDEGGGRC